MILVKCPADVPNVHHYAVIVYSTETYYEDTSYGEDKWRHPSTRGFGDSVKKAYTVTMTNHYVTHDLKKWQDYVIGLEKAGKNYVAFEVNKLAKVKIEVKTTFE